MFAAVAVDRHSTVYPATTVRGRPATCRGAGSVEDPGPAGGAVEAVTGETGEPAHGRDPHAEAPALSAPPHGRESGRPLTARDGALGGRAEHWEDEPTPPCSSSRTDDRIA